MATSLARQQDTRAPGAELLYLRAFPDRVPLPLWKRLIDVTGASVGIVLLLPVLAVIALVISVDSPGGPFFRQIRVGPGGRTFLCWKFRSMRRGAERMLAELADRNEADGHIFKMQDDPRKTRVGAFLRRTSLDELPQLINVVRGEMSLVGPRPPTVDEVLRYDDHHLGRLAATPGITGLWQVTLRGRHDFADMVTLDIRYASEMSFWLDLKVLLMTIPTVLLGRGSY